MPLCFPLSSSLCPSCPIFVFCAILWLATFRAEGNFDLIVLVCCLRVVQVLEKWLFAMFRFVTNFINIRPIHYGFFNWSKKWFKKLYYNYNYSIIKIKSLCSCKDHYDVMWCHDFASIVSMLVIFLILSRKK